MLSLQKYAKNIKFDRKTQGRSDSGDFGMGGSHL